MKSSLPFQNKEHYGSVTKVLGNGCYGFVFATTKDYAIKRITPEYYHDEDGITFAALTEIIALRKINSSFVVELLDVYQEGKSVVLVLPLAEYSLEYAMNTQELRDKLNPQQLALQLFSGLAAVHNANILYLDIKPNNVLIRGDKVLLCDFGFVEFNYSAFPCYEGEMYALNYKAPEVLMSGPGSEKSDVWAMGVVLLEVIICQLRGMRNLAWGVGDKEKKLKNIIHFTNHPNSDAAYWKNGEINIAAFPGRSSNTSSGEEVLIKWGLKQEEASFLDYILKIEPERRPYVFQILDHAWLGDQELKIQQLSPEAKLERDTRIPVQLNVDWKTRTKAIEWMIESLKFYPRDKANKSLSSAVYLFDFCVAHFHIDRKVYYLHAIAVLMIGEIIVISPQINDLLIDSQYTPEEVTKVMWDILRATAFEVNPVTAYHYIAYYCTVFNKDLSKAIPLWHKSLLTEDAFAEPKTVALRIIEEI